MATVAGVKIKPKAKKITSQSIREHAKKDHSPVWDGCEDWDGATFHRHFKNAMDYYRMEFSGKDLKPAVLKWMASVSCAKEDIDAFKKLKDSRSSSTMGAIASCLLRGMPAQRDDFNEGRNSADWLRSAISKAITEGASDSDDEEEATEAKSTVPQVSIQERVREAAFKMTDEIEDAIEAFQMNPNTFDPKAFKVISVLRAKEAKAAHARIIKDFYLKNLAELEEAASPKCDEQLKEGYSHLSKKNMKDIITFYQEIMSACEMLMQEAKVNRAPRKTKAVSKDKLVAKLKYMKTFEPLKLVSINPTDIIGSKELWIYNTKTRKLGKYVASEYHELGIKGTTITGFNENQSICKTIRKPEEKLKEFRAAGKVALRKFLDDINATDTKMNGRINEEVILLKVA